MYTEGSNRSNLILELKLYKNNLILLELNIFTTNLI